jgi:hypothetical protein
MAHVLEGDWDRCTFPTACKQCKREPPLFFHPVLSVLAAAHSQSVFSLDIIVVDLRLFQQQAR